MTIIVTNCSTICAFILGFNVKCHVHGNMHGLHLHYRKYKLLMGRNGILNLFCDEIITKYLISKKKEVSWKCSPINFYPSALRPEGYCRCLRPSVCLSVCLSVCPSVCLSVCLSVRPYDHACPRDNSKNIFQIFSKLAWNILWVNISDKFDDGYRSSLNMRIIDQKVTLTFFEFLK